VENKNGRQDAATMKMLIKLCAVEVKKASKHRINIGNMDTANKNTVDNFINLPSIQMPNIRL